MLKTLTIAAVIAAISSSAFAGTLLDPKNDGLVKAEEGVFVEQAGVRNPYLIPLVACAILCTTVLLNANKNDGNEPNGPTTTAD